VAILESELAALEIIEHVVTEHIDLAVHYCSSTYKHRFQTAAALRRDARLVARSCEEITEAGLVRQMSVTGSIPELEQQLSTFEQACTTKGSHHWSHDESRLYFTAELWDLVDFEKFSTRLRYDLVHRIPQSQSATTEHRLRFGKNGSLYLERSPVMIAPKLSDSELSEFRALLSTGAVDTGKLATRIGKFEWIEPELQDYF
jgi:hypothetical protein